MGPSRRVSASSPRRRGRDIPPSRPVRAASERQRDTVSVGPGGRDARTECDGSNLRTIGQMPAKCGACIVSAAARPVKRNDRFCWSGLEDIVPKISGCPPQFFTAATLSCYTWCLLRAADRPAPSWRASDSDPGRRYGPASRAALVCCAVRAMMGGALRAQPSETGRPGPDSRMRRICRRRCRPGGRARAQMRPERSALVVEAGQAAPAQFREHQLDEVIEAPR